MICPRLKSTWTLRLRKITPDANSVKVGDLMTLQSYTEVIDAKLRYPNTALLYIEFDASQLNGSIPQISCEPRGRVIRVPDNYNPETREYTGVWTAGLNGPGRITRPGSITTLLQLTVLVSVIV